MPLETLFSICNTMAIAGWLLLVFFPRWRYAARLITAVVIPTLLALIYLVLMLWFYKGAEGGFGSLEDVGLLFDQPSLLMAGWVHYLAFDLFIGSWEVRDSQRRKIPYWQVLPCLLLTFLLGPLGLLSYLGLRSVRTRSVLLED